MRMINRCWTLRFGFHELFYPRSQGFLRTYIRTRKMHYGIELLVGCKARGGADTSVSDVSRLTR